MNDEQWEEVLREVRDAEPCPPDECETCAFPEMCRYLRACAGPSEAE